MERNREARRVATATPNGLPRRRHRTSSLRDSPEDDGPLELQETARFRDRKKERDRDKERSDRDRSERERERDRLSRSKRRRGDKYMQGSNREDGLDDSSEESVNDEDEEDLDDAPVRVMPPNPVSVSSSTSPSSALTSNRKSYPPPSKVFRTAPTWKAGDEIGFSVPRKARSASTKRSHDCWSSVGVAGESVIRQASSSPVRPNMGASSAVASPSPAPMSPSSSSLSVKKKIANGPKQRPPKSSTKSSSSIQEDIEIEVAEVLYGLMRQSQGPSKQEVVSNDPARFDSREVNRSTGDPKSRASSPISNSGSAPAQNSAAMPQNSSTSAHPLSAVAPKRKRPRPVSQLEESFASRSSPISTAPKIEPELLAKQEVNSPTLERKPEFAAENGGVSSDLVKSHGPQLTREAARSEQATGVPSSDDKRSSAVEQSQGKDAEMMGKVEEVPAPKKESVDDLVDYSAVQPITVTITGEKERRREEKIEIDLMALPPQSRSSPDRGGEVAQHHEPMATDGEAESKSKRSEGENARRTVSGGNTDLKAEAVEKLSKSSAGGEEGETQKPILNKTRNIDLHLDLERSAALSTGDDSKLNEQPQKQLPQPPLKTSKDDTSSDKTAQPSSLPLSMSVPAGWPAGLPPMGYVAPLQGMVSMDGRTMAPTAIQPPHFLFTQPRPGRCATHCYIAKNIHSHQQFMKNCPYWSATAGAAPLFGAKPYNLNAVPAADLHGNAAARGGDVNHVQDKGQTLAVFPGQQPAVKDKSAQLPTNTVDGAHKKQVYQSLPPGGPSNILHGPATLFFPLGQQQVAAAAAGGAASSRVSSTKSPVATGSAASTSMSTSALNTSAAAGQAAPATMSFSYPNMAANETQYLAILANGAYQFPFPAHVGASQAYRGPHPQVMPPFFNGSYYSSQILHPSQLQQQQQQATLSQSAQTQQNHQNPSMSTASSSSQKHPQHQQKRPQGSSANGVSTNPALQTFPAPKTGASQTQQLEMGGEGSQSTADSRLAHPPNMSFYGQSLALPFSPSNFALMRPPASLSGATTSVSTNGNPAEKQQQPQAFAMSFASINGAATPGLDITSMTQNHAMSFSEAARSNYHMMAAAAAAQAAQQKKNYPGSEDGKSGAPDSSNVGDERKGTTAKASGLMGQSIAFSRPELVETSIASVSGNNVVDSSARSLNLAPAAGRTSRPSVSNSISNVTASSSQQQQFIQLQKHQQFPAAATRNKTPVTSNGIVFSDHHSSASAIAAKFPHAVSAFPPGNTSIQSSQWKNSGRTSSSQVGSPSMSTSTTTSAKNQQQGRHGHTQISFGGNPKASTASQGQQGPSFTQSPSPPVMVGSPSTSSVSKGHGGSPRMTASSSTSNKPAQASSLSTQPGKNSPSVPSQKSSPAAGSGRNVSSVFGSPHHMPVSSSTASSKPQLQHLSQQQLSQAQLSKQPIHQAQMFFNTPYLQTSSTTSAAAAAAVGGFQLQRHRPEQQQPPSKSQVGPSPTFSSGMLSLSPMTNDPAKAAAAAAATAASNIRGGIQSQTVLHAAAQFAAQTSGGTHTLVSAGFPYAHAVSAAAVQVKPAEQKQPAA